MTDQGRSPQSIVIWGILLGGVVAVSTSSIFIRLAMGAAEEQGIAFSLFLAASRLLFASVVLLPRWRKVASAEISKKAIYYAIAAGVALALHFGLWISSLSFISVAVSTSLVTTDPIWVAIIAWFWQKKTLSRQTIIGIALALAGSAIVTWGNQTSIGVNVAPVLGAVLALTGSMAASFYVLFGQEAQRQGLGTRNYVTIAYTAAALVMLPLPLIAGVDYFGYPAPVYGYVLAMAIIAQLVGHTSLNWSLRWLSPVSVTLLVLGEPVIASILGFFVLGEVPSVLVILGGLTIFSGVAIAVVRYPGGD